MAMYKKAESPVSLVEHNKWLLSFFAIALVTLFMAIQWL
jgi:hypothetical protein